MEKLKQYKPIILLLLVVLGVAFYWYELRPANIRKECKKIVSNEKLALTSELEKEALGGDMNKINEAEQKKSEYWYEDCLNEKGLER